MLLTLLRFCALSPDMLLCFPSIEERALGSSPSHKFPLDGVTITVQPASGEGGDARPPRIKLARGTKALYFAAHVRGTCHCR